MEIRGQRKQIGAGTVRAARLLTDTSKGSGSDGWITYAVAAESDPPWTVEAQFELETGEKGWVTAQVGASWTVTMPVGPPGAREPLMTVGARFQLFELEKFEDACKRLGLNESAVTGGADLKM